MKQTEILWSDRLRDLIAADGRTLYRLALDAGVGYQTLHKFVSKKRGIGLDLAARLYEALGYATPRKSAAK